LDEYVQTPLPAGKIRPSLDSRPCSRFNTRLISASGQVAQLVEQGTENPRVGSSILSLATIINKNKNNWMNI
jgi:hypothetical protein